MATASDSAADSEAFKHYLVNSIDATALLPAALSTNLITSQQRSECATKTDPKETFVGYIEQAVNGDYDNFHIFIQILKETGQAHIASRLIHG